jgi:FkbM family methyltransferase
MLISFENLKNHFKHGMPKGVLHIGAHYAQELQSYLDSGIEKIIWIEANHKIADKLKQEISKHPGSTSYFFAAHEFDNLEIDLNVSNNEESSSIYEFGTHAVEHPHVVYVDKITVKTSSIDTFMLTNNIDRSFFDFVNIDIQGAELLALKGMKNQLEHVRYIYLEVNEKPLYQNCALIGDIDIFLSKNGFSRAAVAMTKHGWGDALYVKD